MPRRSENPFKDLPGSKSRYYDVQKDEITDRPIGESPASEKPTPEDLAYIHELEEQSHDRALTPEELADYERLTGEKFVYETEEEPLINQEDGGTEEEEGEGEENPLAKATVLGKTENSELVDSEEKSEFHMSREAKKTLEKTERDYGETHKPSPKRPKGAPTIRKPETIGKKNSERLDDAPDM